jgi:hypothetical protein
MFCTGESAESAPEFWIALEASGGSVGYYFAAIVGVPFGGLT